MEALLKKENWFKVATIRNDGDVSIVLVGAGEMNFDNYPVVCLLQAGIYSGLKLLEMLAWEEKGVYDLNYTIFWLVLLSLLLLLFPTIQGVTDPHHHSLLFCHPPIWLLYRATVWWPGFLLFMFALATVAGRIDTIGPAIKCVSKIWFSTLSGLQVLVLLLLLLPPPQPPPPTLQALAVNSAKIISISSFGVAAWVEAWLYRLVIDG